MIYNYFLHYLYDNDRGAESTLHAKLGAKLLIILHNTKNIKQF